MAMKDFLLAYADRAPKLEKAEDSDLIRFRDSGSSSVWCPISVAAGNPDYLKGAADLGLSLQERNAIIGAADWGADNFCKCHDVCRPNRILRAVLEKLAA